MMLGGLPVLDDAADGLAEHGETPCGLGVSPCLSGGAATQLGGERRTQRRISRADSPYIRVNY